MKNCMKFIRYVLPTLLLTIGFMSMTNANAQTDHPATIDPTSKVIKLDEDVPFGYLYELDISNMNFASEAKANTFFEELNAELATFTVHFADKKVDIALKLRAEPKWGAKEWNEYFAKLVDND